ncbi:hypothetical protein [Roseibium sp. SCP14]|uniref:hypothetical protein n=1 Tax=Roseibium sp. SCP14 TaxID=3141375 RepID=UPI00333817A4
MTDKPYTPRTGGRYERDQDTGKRTRVEGTERPAQNPTPAKPAKTSAKQKKEG